MADNKTSILLTADDRTRAAFESAKRGLAGLETSARGINGVLAGLGAGVTVGGLATFVKGTIDSADAMNDMAIRTGTSVEALARYQLAAKQSGTDLESLSQAMGKLSVYMAKNADEAARLGITAKDPVDAFAQLADVIGQVEDPAQRNALAMRVLGKSYAEVMPLLAQGGDALREQAAAAGPYAERMATLAKAADEFNDSLASIGQSAQSALLPLVQYLTDTMNAAIQAAEGLEGMEAAVAGLGQLGTVGETVAVSWAEVAYVFKQVGDSMGNVAAKYQAFYTGNFKQAMAIEEMGKDSAAKRRAEHDAQIARIMQGPDTTLTKIGGNRYSGATDFIKEQEKAIAALSKGGKDLGAFFGDDDADKINKALAKAFDTKPLDDYLASFADRRTKIVAEYAKLKADLTGEKTGATSTDFAVELTRGREALSRGDAAGAASFAARAKSTLAAYGEGEGNGLTAGYLSEQLKAFELSMVDAEEKTANAAANALKKSLDAAAAEVAQMDPIVVPLASEAIANDLRASIDIIRKELAANPLKIPVQATSPQGVYADVSDAALKRGGR